jgi:hypothetical protein
MQTRDEIIAALQNVDREGAAYWSAFAPDVFFAKIGSSWSPAETVRHLVKAIRPVTKALSMPKLALRVMFGRPRRAPETYDALRTRYLGLLESGGQAGRFAPTPRRESDLASWRLSILRQLSDANASLAAAMARWPDGALDRYQLPHPLLGKLTVREMLFFTVYHQHHHMAVVSRRREAAGTT